MFAALSFIEIAFLVVFFLLMVIGTALDRRHVESPKWWILGIGVLAVVGWFWNDMSFSSILSVITSSHIWVPVGIYLAVGLGYSVIEFVLSVRKMARIHGDAWSKFINSKTTEYFRADGSAARAEWVTQRSNGTFFVRNRNALGDDSEETVTKVDTHYRDIMAAAQAPGASGADKEAATRLVQSYYTDPGYNISSLRRDFVEVVLNKGTYQVEPAINRTRLANFIGAWTFMWPAYAFSLILGDFLVELFRIIGDMFAKFGGRFVKMMFADTFKV